MSSEKVKILFIYLFSQIRWVKGITPKIFKKTLMELEPDDLVIRKIYIQVPLKIEYSSPESGLELLPFVDQMRI